MNLKNYTMSRLPPLGRITKHIVEKEIRADYAVVLQALVDFTAIEVLRREKKVSYTALYAKAIAGALKKYPFANRRLSPVPLCGAFFGRLQVFSTVDIAVAVERLQPGSENVAFMDVVRDVENKSLEALSTEIASLRNLDNSNKQWRAFSNLARLPFPLGGLAATLPVYSPRLWARYRGGASMISSPGKYGMDFLNASWAHPLGFSYGYVKERPLVVEGHVVPRVTSYLTMSFDRRLLGGAQAGMVFNEIISTMESRNGADTGS